MYKSISAIALLIFMLSSCSDNTEESKIEMPFEKISFNLLCGWCAGEKNIEIDKDAKIAYEKTFPCDPESNIKEERTLTEEEAQALIAVYELEPLLSIDLNQCGECYDGCDDTLIIEGSNGENHSIRYDQFDSYEELETIRPFIESLQALRDSF